MKTFEEAFEVVAPIGPVERAAEMIAQVKEHAARNRELIAEIMASPPVAELFRVSLTSGTVVDALMTVFIQGVLVGMEMERTETGVAMP